MYYLSYILNLAVKVFIISFIHQLYCMYLYYVTNTDLKSLLKEATMYLLNHRQANSKYVRKI